MKPGTMIGRADIVMNMRRAGLLVVAAALATAPACSGGGSAPQRTPPPDAKRVDASTAGAVSGRVLLDGPLPRNAPMKMQSDPVCMREQKDGTVLETFTGENGGLGNVFVYVKDGLGNYYFDTPSEPARLDQKGCQYVPHVFGVQVAQNIDIVNSDATVHTVQAVASANQEFNFSQPIQGQTDTRFFTRPETMVQFRCNIHPWMSSYAGVLEHPYFAVTRPAGDFSLKNVPAGTYTVEAWHEKLGTQTQTVTLADNETKEISFTFKAPAS